MSYFNIVNEINSFNPYVLHENTYVWRICDSNGIWYSSKEEFKTLKEAKDSCKSTISFIFLPIYVYIISVRSGKSYWWGFDGKDWFYRCVNRRLGFKYLWCAIKRKMKGKKAFPVNMLMCSKETSETMYESYTRWESVKFDSKMIG